MRKSSLIPLLASVALLAAACGQRDNVTPHTQPSPPLPSPKPQPLEGKPVPGAGNPVFPGDHPATPGGAHEPGQPLPLSGESRESGKR